MAGEGTMKLREKKRLDAAENLCRSFRKAISDKRTEAAYMRLAYKWLTVWVNSSPPNAWQSEPSSPTQKPRPRR